MCFMRNVKCSVSCKLYAILRIMLPDAKILYENSMFENLKFVSSAKSNVWNEKHLFWLFWCGNMKMIHSQKYTRHKEIIAIIIINNIASSAHFSVSTKQSTHSSNTSITTRHMKTYVNFSKNRKQWKIVYIQVIRVLENQLRLCFQTWCISQRSRIFIVFRGYFE